MVLRCGRGTDLPGEPAAVEAELRGARTASTPGSDRPGPKANINIPGCNWHHLPELRCFENSASNAGQSLGDGNPLKLWTAGVDAQGIFSSVHVSTNGR
jgi:hypothetical protein